MPDTRTVRDAADAPPTGHSTSILVFDGDNPILDALIGAQGRVVYTEESLLAAGHAYEDAHKAALNTNDYEAGLIAGARAVLTEAGGVVAEYAGKCPVCEGRGTMPKPYGNDRDKGRTFYGCPACCLDPLAIGGTGRIAVLKRKEE